MIGMNAEERVETISDVKQFEALMRLGKRLQEANIGSNLVVTFDPALAAEPGPRVAMVARRTTPAPMHESALRAYMNLANECGFEAELSADATTWTFWPHSAPVEAPPAPPAEKPPKK